MTAWALHAALCVSVCLHGIFFFFSLPNARCLCWCVLTAHLEEDGHVVDATIYLKHAGLSWFSLGGSAVPVVSLFGMRIWFGGWGCDGFRCCLLYGTEITEVQQAR